MAKIKNIYSLRELHDLLEKHQDLSKLILFLDIDLTIVQSNEKDEDVIIEPEITKRMFDFLHKNKVWYTFVTARFHEIVCNEKKRNSGISEIRENIEALYPVFEQVGIDCSEFKNNKDEELTVIKNDKNITVGIMYKGILLGNKKGQIIKHFRIQYGLDKSHPHVIFIDDLDRYLKSVQRYVPEAIVVKRFIPEIEV